MVEQIGKQSVGKEMEKEVGELEDSSLGVKKKEVDVQVAKEENETAQERIQQDQQSKVNPNQLKDPEKDEPSADQKFKTPD